MLIMKSFCKRISMKKSSFSSIVFASSSTSAIQQCLFESVRKNHGRKLTNFTEQILANFVETTKAFQKLSPMRKELISELENAVCKKSTLIPVGSFSSQMSTVNSDLDLVLLPNELTSQRRSRFVDSFRTDHTFRVNLMQNVLNLLKIHRIGKLIDWKHSQMRQHAQVPLVVLKFHNGLGVDIQFANEHSIRNTNLIRHYIKADVRFCQLNLWAQQWLSAFKAKNSVIGRLSSYQITLLVVHFLQRTDSNFLPILPVLNLSHPELVGPELSLDNMLLYLQVDSNELTDLNWKSANEQHVGHLAVQMVEYYQGLDLMNYGIFIDDGTLGPSGKYNGRLFIRDPFSKESICRGANTLLAFESALKTTVANFVVGQCLVHPLTVSNLRGARQPCRHFA